MRTSRYVLLPPYIMPCLWCALQLTPENRTPFGCLQAGVQQSVALVDSVADRIKQLERRLEVCS